MLEAESFSRLQQSHENAFENAKQCEIVGG